MGSGFVARNARLQTGPSQLAFPILVTDTTHGTDAVSQTSVGSVAVNISDTVHGLENVTVPAAVNPIVWGSMPTQFPVLQGSTLNVGANATSNLNFPLTFTLLSGNLAGTGITLGTGAQSGTFTLAANATPGSVINLSLMANDGQTHTAPSPTFSILVVAVSVTQGAPVLLGFPNQITLVQNESALLGLYAYSPAGWTLSCSLIQGVLPNPGLSLNSSGVLSATTTMPVGQMDGFRVRYDDGHGLTTDSPVFSIIVMPKVPTPAWLKDGSGVPNAWNLVVPPNVVPDPATITLTVLPTGGSIGPGTYSYRIAYFGAGDTRASIGTASPPVTITIASGTTNKIRIGLPRPALSTGVIGYMFYGRVPGDERFLDFNNLQFNGLDDGGGNNSASTSAPNSPVATMRVTGVGVIRQATNQGVAAFTIAPGGSMTATQLAAVGVTMQTDGKFRITDTTPPGIYPGVRLRITDTGDGSFADSPPFVLRIDAFSGTSIRWSNLIQLAYGIMNGGRLDRPDWSPAISNAENQMTLTFGPNSAVSSAALAAAGVTFTSGSDIVVAPTAVPGTIFDGVRILARDTQGVTSESSPIRIYITDSRPVWSTLLSTFNLRRGETEDVGSFCGSPNYYSLTFTLATGTLPPGVTMDAAGIFTANAGATLGTISGLSLFALDSIGQTAVSPLFAISVQVPLAIQSVAHPVGFTFTVGVPASYNMAAYWTGSPSSITFNKPQISDELTLTGISYDPVTKILSYDGTIGEGTGYGYVAIATDGSLPQHEFILPYGPTRPFQAIPHTGAGNVDFFGTGPSGVVLMDQRTPPTTTSGMVMGFGSFIPDLYWENLNGDWFDAGFPPQRQGTFPWATFTANAFQTFVTDITALAKQWQTGEVQNYGLFLKPQSGTSVSFRGPAYATTAERPFLNITYVDGQVEPPILASVAATMGGGSVVAPVTAFGPSPTAFLYFDLTTIAVKEIATCTVSLTVFNRFGTPIVGIFAARWEAQVSGVPIKWGIAENFPTVGGVVESGLEASPDIHIVERMPDTNFGPRGWHLPYSAFTGTPAQQAALQYIVGDTDPQDLVHYQPLRPGIKAIKWMIPANSTGGHRMIWSPWGKYGTGPGISSSFVELQEVYMRWYQRWADDYNYLQVNSDGPNAGGHASGPAGNSAGDSVSASTKKPGVVAFSGRWEFNPNVIGDLYKDSKWVSVNNFETVKSESTSPLGVYGVRVNDQYRYDPGVASPGAGSGQINLYNINHRQLMRKNRWHCIEIHALINSQYPGCFFVSANGAQRVWIDGRLAFYRHDASLSLNSLFGMSYCDVQWFYGGSGFSPNQLSIYHSQMVISRRYIGPMAG
jgi:hypothetical protein